MERLDFRSVGFETRDLLHILKCDVTRVSENIAIIWSIKSVFTHSQEVIAKFILT